MVERIRESEALFFGFALFFFSLSFLLFFFSLTLRFFDTEEKAKSIIRCPLFLSASNRRSALLLSPTFASSTHRGARPMSPATCVFLIGIGRGEGEREREREGV